MMMMSSDLTTNSADPDSQQAQDLAYSREVYLSLLQKGQAAFDESLELCRNTEHPRSYEVMAGLLKSLAEVNGSLLDLHSKKQELESSKQPSQRGQITNNNVFIGSSTDLQRLLQAEERDDKEVTTLDHETVAPHE